MNAPHLNLKSHHITLKPVLRQSWSFGDQKSSKRLLTFVLRYRVDSSSCSQGPFRPVEEGRVLLPNNVSIPRKATHHMKLEGMIAWRVVTAFVRCMMQQVQGVEEVARLPATRSPCHRLTTRRVLAAGPRASHGCLAHHVQGSGLSTPERPLQRACGPNHCFISPCPYPPSPAVVCGALCICPPPLTQASRTRLLLSW